MFNRLFSRLIPSKPLSPLWCEFTDRGDRENNEDYLAHLHLAEGILLVVADGLGGHQAGELASEIFCRSLIRLAEQAGTELARDPEAALAHLAQQAANAMGEEVKVRMPGADAHTTCAVAWVALPDRQLTTLYIGDTRLYRFDGRKIHWRSRDHSVVQMLLDMEEIREDEVAGHPERSLLTRSIATTGVLQPSVRRHSQSLGLGESLLLCSDGFWERLSPEEICSLAQQGGEREQRLKALAQLARQRAEGKSDNITAQLLWFE